MLPVMSPSSLLPPPWSLWFPLHPCSVSLYICKQIQINIVLVLLLLSFTKVAYYIHCSLSCFTFNVNLRHDDTVIKWKIFKFLSSFCPQNCRRSKLYGVIKDFLVIHQTYFLFFPGRGLHFKATPAVR